MGSNSLIETLFAVFRLGTIRLQPPPGPNPKMKRSQLTKLKLGKVFVKIDLKMGWIFIKFLLSRPTEKLTSIISSLLSQRQEVNSSAPLTTAAALWATRHSQHLKNSEDNDAASAESKGKKIWIKKVFKISITDHRRLQRHHKGANLDKK